MSELRVIALRPETAHALRVEIDRLRLTIRLCISYMNNAKFDIEHSVQAKTALATLNGGLRIAGEALGEHESGADLRDQEHG